MGVLTSNLPKIKEPKAEDTLLMVESVKLSENDLERFRTVRLTLAQAAAFFGAELVKEGNPVGAALSSKAAKSAQETVEAAGVTGREITLEAADLQAYIDALPRLRTEHLIINVKVGHVPETLTLTHFYGPGYIHITGPGAENGGVLDDGAAIIYCSNYISVDGFDVRGKSVGVAAKINSSTNVNLSKLTANGEKFPSVDDPKILFGLTCSNSVVNMSEVTFCNMTHAVYTAGGLVRAVACGGDGNTNGLAVEHGGLILLSGNTPELMGGTSNMKWGGVIFNKNGELI